MPCHAHHRERVRSKKSKYYNINRQNSNKIINRSLKNDETWDLCIGAKIVVNE